MQQQQKANLGRPSNRRRPKGCKLSHWNANLRRVKNFIIDGVTVAPFQLTSSQLWKLSMYEKSTDKKKFILSIFK